MHVPYSVKAAILSLGLLMCPAPIRAERAQQSLRALSFYGQIEAVHFEKGAVVVRHGKIPGYADSGTTEYSIEDLSLLNRLQPGDDIRATVYSNDLTLHHVQLVFRPAPKKGKAVKQ